MHVIENNCTVSGNTILNSIKCGIELAGTDLPSGCSDNSVKDNYVTGVVGSGQNGIILANATFNLISGNHVSQCAYAGIMLDSTSNNNTLSLNYVFDNGNGMYVVGNNNYISQNQLFDDRSGAAITQVFGIDIQAGASTNAVIGNNVYNNLWGSIHDSGRMTEIINNQGYNPVGRISSNFIWNGTSFNYIVDGYAWNAASTGNSSTWNSATTYTNWESPKTLYVSGGTVTAIVVDGQTLYTSATNCTIILQLGDTFSVTFSTAPTINVIGQ